MPSSASNPFSRRSFLRASGASALGIAVACSLARPAQAASAASAAAGTGGAATADPFAAVRSTWAGLSAAVSIDPTNTVYAAPLASLDASAASILSKLDGSSSSQLFTDLPLGPAYSSANVTTSFDRLKTLATAYVTPGTSYTGDSTTLASVVSGLDFMASTIYSASSSLPVYGYGNWWDWQIGSPQAFEDTAVLVYSALTSEQISTYCAAIDHFVPDPTVMVQASGTTVSTGGNRLDMCRVAIVRGALGEDSDKIAQGVAGISPTLTFVTSGDGLYSDGSWIQHTEGPAGIAYTGTYGGIWLGDLALLLTTLAGSQWAVTDPNLANVFFATAHAFTPVIYNGLMLDSVRGRAVSRPTEPDGSDGLSNIANFLMLAGAGDPAQSLEIKSAAKGWLQRTPYPYLTDAGLVTLSLVEQVLGDATVPAAPEPVAHHLFPSMARAVHRRPGWALALSMASEHVAYYETGNGENVQGWHTGDGMTYVYLDTDNTQYDDQFWPTVDPYRLPGTTASLLALTAGQGGAWANPHPTTTWVGGSTDGEYAAIGQDLQGPFSTLTAKKSWFCVNDAVVCLGAGITAADGTEVDTIVDNRNLGATGTNTLTVDGAVQPASQETQAFRRAGWAHLDGHNGYVFPAGADLTALREARTGAWSTIEAGASTTDATRQYATLYLDHGTDPAAAQYAYILMPGATSVATHARAAQREWLQILANTPACQAVEIRPLQFTAANFYAAGAAGQLTADAPASIMIRESADGRHATICVSDPAAQNTGLTVTWHRPVARVTSAPASLTTATCGRTLTLTFGSTTALAGATQTVEVALA